MNDLVFFGVGSPLIYEYEESCRRKGLTVAFGIKNRDVQDMCSPDVTVRTPGSLLPEERRIPCIIPLFTPIHRATAVAEAEAFGLNLDSILIDPTAIVASNSPLSPGCFVNAGTVIGASCTFGSYVTINRNCSIGHHNELSAFVSIGPGSTTCGNVTIGRGAMIGAGSVVLSSVTIGEGAIIGAGSVVVKDVAPYTKFIMKRDMTITSLSAS